MTSCSAAFNKRTIWQLKSYSNVVMGTRMHVGSCKCSCFFAFLYASHGLWMSSLPRVHIAHWTAWLGQTQGHSTRVFCVVLLIAPLFLSVSFFLFTRPLLTTNFSASSESSVFFYFFSAVEGCCQSWNSVIHSESLPDVSFWSPACWVGVACHRALVSPQWLTTLSRRLPTDRCWLTNQQLSTTNLCCGPSRLTAFCVTVIERNRWSGRARNLPSCFVVAMSSFDRCCCYQKRVS